MEEINHAHKQSYDDMELDKPHNEVCDGRGVQETSFRLGKPGKSYGEGVVSVGFAGWRDVCSLGGRKAGRTAVDQAA